MVYPIVYRVSTIQGGPGFLPSTVGTASGSLMIQDGVYHNGFENNAK
jgi:hypothetical protein